MSRSCPITGRIRAIDQRIHDMLRQVTLRDLLDDSPASRVVMLRTATVREPAGRDDAGGSAREAVLETKAGSLSAVQSRRVPGKAPAKRRGEAAGNNEGEDSGEISRRVPGDEGRRKGGPVRRKRVVSVPRALPE